MAHLHDRSPLTSSLHYVAFLGAALSFCFLILGTSAAMAAGGSNGRGESIECPGDLSVGPMTRSTQPVVLVHGFMSHRGTWDPAPDDGPDDDLLHTVLTGLQDIAIANFDYSHVSTEWWGHPDIAPKLAETIQCMYEASVSAGGPGKVAIVAHSMGGLAARCAVSAHCSGHPDTAEQVGLVITLGTPNLGSPLRVGPVGSFGETMFGSMILPKFCRVPSALVAQIEELCDTAEGALTSHAGIAFTAGSQELRSLPAYPPGIAVRALAGRMHFGFSILTKRMSLDLGDGVVNVDSALAASTPEATGGTHIVDCGILAAPRIENFQLMGASLPTCMHTNETRTEAFIEDVKATLTTYMAGNTARAEEVAQRESDQKAAVGILPAPVGPSLTYEYGAFPFAARLISAALDPEVGGNPAPAGWTYLLVAVQVRGLLADRGTEAPDVSLFDIQWPAPENCAVDDAYVCSDGYGFSGTEMLTDYIPSDATDIAPAPDYYSDVVIPPGEPYDVVFHQLVPEDEFTLQNGRLKLGYRGFGPDRRQYLSLAGLPDVFH